MPRAHLHLVGGALVVAAWLAAALLARPPAGVLDARWVPDDCHPAPGASGEVLVRWSDLRAAGVPSARLPFGAHDLERHEQTARVRAARAGDDVYLAWPILFERLVLVRMRFDARGVPEHADALASLHGDRLLELSAHPGGLVLWTAGDHGIRRATLDRELDVRDFRLEASAAGFGTVVRSTPVPFAARSVLVEEDDRGRRALLAPTDPVRGVAAARIPLGSELTTCLVSGTQLARLGPSLSFARAFEDWRVRYGTARVVGIAGGFALVSLLLLGLAFGLRRLDGLDRATAYAGSVGRDEAGALTWYDDERGPSPLRRVGRTIGEPRGRAVLLGRPGVPEGYRGAAVSEANVLFEGDLDGWAAWRRRRRADLVRGVWLGVAACTLVAWGLLATALF